MARARSLPLAVAALLFAAAAAPREAAAQDIDPRDRDALLAVKAAFKNVQQLTSWSASNRICSNWIGITCVASGRVTELGLGYYGLEGSISPAIGNLENLKNLWLYSNSLTGSIPDSIGNLANLQILSLPANSLTGSIPDSICNLVNLAELSLDSNSLTGSIPDSIGNLTNLQYFSLAQNSLTGSIPDSIGNITNLQNLALDSNKLHGRVSGFISKLTGLRELHLNNNKLTGSITLSSDNLDVLEIHDNYFSGPINSTTNGQPYCYSNYTNNCIYRDDAGGCGAAQEQRPPQECAAFCQSGSPEGACGGRGTCGYDTSTCTCDAGYALTTGTCGRREPPPPPPPRLPKPPPPRPPTRPPPLPLSSEVAALLEFKRAIVYDTFDELSDWKTGIANYSVCDWNGVYCTTTLPKLVNKLSLSGVQLKGTISPSIGSLPALEELDLSNNKFTDSIPDTIGRLQLLKKMILSNNELTGSIPLSFGNLTSLTEMSMSFNNLTGIIPFSFGNLTALASLNLRNNQLNGSIPASIGTLRSLKLLTLSYNRLTGIIPTSFGGLLAIRQINLANNSLIGPLVFDFGLLEEVSFNFNNNYFSGELSITVNGEARNCVGFDLNCFETTCSPQRDANSCNSFCNARQPQGACGGNGFCSSNGSRPTCSCDVGYNISPDGYTCIFGGRGFGLNTTAPLNSSLKLNRYFRYATTGYLRRRSGKSSWQVAIAWNWTEEGAVQGIKDQGSCNSCWIFSAISAIESAFFIVNGGKLPIPQLAEQQVLSCSPSGKTCTSGGWPQEALDYAANNALISQSNFTGQASCGKGDIRFKISWFEQAATHGWMGLLLILQQQPAVVNIEASGLTFTNYNGGVFDDEDCFSNGVDHSVVVVGYDLSADPPFWILRNSWGQNWGEQGYMRIKVSAGLGICGINSLPALMPVVKPAVNDPCFRNSYASTVLKTANGPGTMNPCGNGVCIVNGSTNLCDCTEGFVAVTNSDLSQTCAPLSPCTFAASNPCGVGTCLNAVATPGAYACACPLGYAADSPDGILTCVPAAIATGLQYFTVPAGANMSCYDIYILYGISKSIFLAQNMNLNCLLPLPGGTRVNVTNPRNCSVVYAVNEGDTCTAIATYFNVSSIFGPGSPNPDLDCSQLRVFQQVCIQRGALAYAGPCTKSYDVQTDESCFSIIRNQLAGDIRRFYTLNPGVYCGKLMLSTSSSAVIGQKVCLEANDLASAVGCKGKTYTLQKGDRCASLKSRFAGKETFKKLNGFPCTSGALKKKKIICVSK